MRNININCDFNSLPVNPSVALKNNTIFRGEKLNTEEGFNTDIDFRFEIAGVKLGLSLESAYKMSDDYVTLYAAYSFSAGCFDNTIAYSKRKLTNTGTESEEVTIVSDYLRNQEGPTYNNILSYDLNTNDYIDIVSMSLENFIGVDGKVSYAFNKMKDGSGNEKSNYLQFDVNYPMANYEVCASYVKQLEGAKEDYLTYGFVYSRNE